MKEQFGKERTPETSGFASSVWVLLLAGITGASAACFAGLLAADHFASVFYRYLFAGAAAGIVLAAISLVITGRKRISVSGYAAKAVVMMAVLAMFFSAASMLLISGKDLKAPVIAFSDEVITMREGDPVSVLCSNLTVSDDRDGDLMDQLEVVSFVYAEDGKTADVMYAAADSSGNRTTATQVVFVEGTPWPAE